VKNPVQREIRARWKPRKKHSHKGDYGRIFIVAGSRDFSGAASLAGLACLRAGAGLVTLGVPDVIHALVARRRPELMVKALPSNKQGTLSRRALKPILSFLRTQDILALGPGLSQNPETQKLIRDLLAKSSCPLVLDADGLNALQGHTKILRHLAHRSIFTPHPGEFTRVFGGKLSDKEADRKKRALEAARQTQAVIVLKGHHTAVAGPSGKVYVNKTGNPGMATGGTGDVLTGILAALLGQDFSLWDAARFGVYLHGLAGDLAARRTGEVSLVAGDILLYLPQAIQKTLTK
jgi:hydroxyethylthiazole kinase-like uncharacterized protein yjeF